MVPTRSGICNLGYWELARYSRDTAIPTTFCAIPKGSTLMTGQHELKGGIPKRALTGGQEF